MCGVQDVDASYEPLFQKLYVSFLTQLVKIIPENSDLSGPFHSGNEMDCLFIQRLALFFCNFFRLHLQVGLLHASSYTRAPELAILSHSATNRLLWWTPV